MKKVRIGIVGTGGIAHRFAEAARNVQNTEITAVASRTEESAQKFALEFGIENAFSSYEAMAASNLIDAAYIAVPHSFHKECSVMMMKAGKNVICEKPMAVNVRECEEMIACAKENNVLLMEAMWTRLLPGTIKLLEIVSSGVLGEIKGVEGRFCYNIDENNMKHHVMQNWNGGGGLLDVGVYCLYFAYLYLGSDIEKISAFSENFEGIDAHTQIMIKYNSGAIASLSSAVLLRKDEDAYIYGSKGYAHIDKCHFPQRIELSFDDGGRDIISVPCRGNGFEEQIEHFCDLVIEGQKESPINTHENTLIIANQMQEIRKQIGITYPQDAV